MIWAGSDNMHGEMKNAYKILVRNLTGRQTTQRPRRRWEDNIRMDLRETVWEGIDWIHVIRDRDQWRALMNMVMTFRVP
jgi:hypothetical protein